MLVDHLVEDHRLVAAELSLQLFDLLDVLADHLVEDHRLDVAGIHFHLVCHWVVEVVVMACLNPTMLRRMRWYSLVWYASLEAFCRRSQSF